MKPHRWPFISLGLAYLALTVPFVSRLPYNWDAAQFVLAVRHYDIGMHQPHPPGYPLFVVLGKLLQWVVSENIGLVLVAALFGFASVVVLYLFCYRLWPSRLGASLIACAWMLNPLFWLYRETALTYTVDAAVSITLGYLVWLTITQRARYYVLGSAGLLAVAGAVRPSLLVLLLPLFLLQLSYHRRNWKLVLQAGGIVIVGTVAWLIPVAWLTGGLSEYLTHSRNLYGTVTVETNILEQTKLVLNTLLVSFNFILIPMIAGLVLLAIRHWPAWRKFTAVYIYVAAWVLPALLFYCFGHFGQLGYALILLPPFYVLLTTVGPIMLEQWIWRWLGLGCLVLVSLVFLALSPSYAHPNFFPTTRAELYLQHLARFSPNLFKMNRTIIHANDVKLAQLTSEFSQYAPADTIMITGRDMLYASPANGLLIRNDELFRELSVMLPDYQIVELAPQRDYYLSAQANRMDTVYASNLTLPNNVRYVILVLDALPTGLEPTGLLTTAQTGYQLGIMDQPWQFAGFTIQRANDTIVAP